MTVQNDKTKEVLLGDGIITAFPYTFALLDKTHIKVYLTDLDGNTTLLESGYNVDTKNCNVIYPYPFGKPLPAGWKMTIMRVVPVTQEMDLINQGALPNETLEKAYDRLTMIAQQLNEESSRSLKADVTVIGTPHQLPAPVPGKAIGWNADGTGMFNYDNPGAAVVEAEAAVVKSEAAAAQSLQSAQMAAEKANTVVEIVDTMVPWYVGDQEPPNPFPWMAWVSTADGYIKQRNAANNGWIIRAPISGMWGMPVGTMITLTGLPSSTPGFVMATGTTLIRSDYPLLWNFAANQSNNIVTDEVWSAEKRYGSYSYGDGETTFRIPMIYDFVRGLPAGGTIGRWYEDTIKLHKHKLAAARGDNNAQINSATNRGLAGWSNGLDGYTDGEGVALMEETGGPETSPKHGTLPYYIYTGEVW